MSLTGLSILVVEDEALLRRRIAARLESQGAEVTQAGTLAAARKFIGDLGFDFVFLDVNLPDGRGTELLQERSFPPNTGVIIITAHGGVPGAVEAMRLGALDYLVKPFDPLELPVVIERAHRSRQSARLDEHRRTQAPELFFGSSLAELETMGEKILAADRRLQGELPPVLIEGETGTGKTTVARWLHRRGPRAEQPLVEVNCSALPETLAESELFGHERGAFTDARAARMGLFEAASGGTLFLDELPSLALPLQAKVLTAIEDRTIRRLGGNKMIGVDVRIVAAANCDLKSLVATGRFREDLYHRLDLYRISIPPLRDRGDDILRLAEIFIARLCHRHRLPAKTLTPSGRRRLLHYKWPGNVRELSHELERAIVFEEGSELKFPQLTFENEPEFIPPPSKSEWLNESFTFEGFALEDAIDRLIQLALKRADSNVSAAARLLNVPRDYIRYRLHGPRAPKTDGK